MVKTAQVLGIIPARAHSTRFPFKILTPILGKPMIQYVWESAKAARSLSDVIVATDHPDIFNCVKAFGGEVVMTPSDLPSGSDRVAFVAKDRPSDIIVNLQGDEPLLKSEFIDQLVDSLINHPDSQLSTLAVLRKEAQELANPNCVKVVFDDNHKALYFSRSPLKTSSSGEFFKHIGIYAYRRKALFEFCQLSPSSLEVTEKLEQLRALQHGMAIQVCVVDQDTIAVDVPQDVSKVEDYLKKRNLSRGKMSTGENS
ncbi:MAG: 3-deoxy-manno-octulosonate cytidylyltransferase [Proteobacteria bacterium]|nr:3-deoxy-manno-octulosonate cytidylyltransferase [Pseudomonadota bacterium]NBY20435.1 3-deoxy-manno-octulosonate cytidylyltransferase [bacterium]